MGALSLLLVAVVAEPSSSVSEERSSGASPWAASLQTGAGFLGSDAAMLVRPRLSYAQLSDGATLSAPIWLSLIETDRPVAGGGGTTAPMHWLARPHDPQTYLGFLERVSYATPLDTVVIEAGTLAAATLGHGVLVDGYQSTLDPLRPRTGGRADVNAAGLSATALTDSFMRPHLIAASIAAAPLNWLHEDPEARFRARIDGAVDPLAPVANGRTPVGGGALDLSYDVVRGEGITLEAFAAGAVLSAPAAGAHAGFDIEWHSGLDRRADVIRLRLDGIAAQTGYSPGYFDVAYELERWPNDGAPAKAEKASPGGFGGRASLDAKLAWLRVGASAWRIGENGSLKGAAYVGVTTTRTSLAATWMQREIRHGEDLLRFGATGAAMLETSVTVLDNLFLFGHVRRGFRMDAGAPMTVVDWVSGVGYGGGIGS